MKKTLAVLFSLVLIFSIGCFNVPVKADPADDELHGIVVGDLTANSRGFYSIYDQSAVRYDEYEHTLYLNNANISGITGIRYGLCEADDTKPFTIVLSGDNYIQTNDQNGNTETYGIRSEHFSHSDCVPLIIKGNGTLNIQVQNTGGYGNGIAAGGGLTIKGNAEVRVTMDDACKSSGICLDNEHETKLKLDGAAKLTVYSPKEAFYKCSLAFGKKYTPKVKAGNSANDIKVNKKKPSKKIYNKYSYVSIEKA